MTWADLFGRFFPSSFTALRVRILATWDDGDEVWLAEQLDEMSPLDEREEYAPLPWEIAE